MTLKLGIQHRVLKYMYYQVCSNDAPGLTLTYFMARSDLLPCAFVWERVKIHIMDFSETVVPYIAVYKTHSSITRRQFLEPKYEEKNFLGQFSRISNFR